VDSELWTQAISRTPEGVLRQEIFRGGEWRETVIYGLLRHEL
jgi:RimJ/RimL family protein N-acetyltransferase